MLARPLVLVSLTVGLVSCGGGSSPKSIDAACRAAAEVFAASPGPGETEASHAAFLEAADAAVREAAFPIRDRADHSDDWALKELSSLLDSFPVLIGQWTVEEVAWRSRATVVRIAEVARELGEPSCGADTFRLDAWAALTEQLTPPPADASTYLQGLEALCSETLGSFAFSTAAGPVGAAINWAGANNALRTFNARAGRLVPSARLVDGHVGLLAAAQSLDALLPDVATTIDGDRLARIQDSLGRMATAFKAIGVGC